MWSLYICQPNFLRYLIHDFSGVLVLLPKRSDNGLNDCSFQCLAFFMKYIYKLGLTILGFMNRMISF